MRPVNLSTFLGSARKEERTGPGGCPPSGWKASVQSMKTDESMSLLPSMDEWRRPEIWDILTVAAKSLSQVAEIPASSTSALSGSGKKNTVKPGGSFSTSWDNKELTLFTFKIL